MKGEENGNTVALVQKLNQKGITLIELVVVIAIIGIAAIALVAPELGRFRSNYNVRSCATDLIQNMRVARAMAIKENKEYLITFDTTNDLYRIGFDGNNDNDLLDGEDGFGECVGAGCVRVVNLSDCGNDIIFGYASGTTPLNGPPDAVTGLTIPADGISFNPERAEFNPNGSTDILGSAYFQQTYRGYSYVVIISTRAGGMNMWKWDGDKDNTGVTTWREIR